MVHDACCTCGFKFIIKVWAINRSVFNALTSIAIAAMITVLSRIREVASLCRHHCNTYHIIQYHSDIVIQQTLFQ